MARGGTALAMIVAGLIAACGASSAPSTAPVPAATDAVTVTASPTTTASATLEATDSPSSPIPPPTLGPSASPLSESDAVPPKPSGVSFDERRMGDDPSTTEITQSVSWEEPLSEGVEIRVYGVTECVARPVNPVPNSDGPCLVVHTPLPASVRTLLATAPASDGMVSWNWTGTFDCGIGLAYDPQGPAYHAVVLAAYSASDHSIFAIAEPGGWFQPGPDEVVC